MRIRTRSTGSVVKDFRQHEYSRSIRLDGTFTWSQLNAIATGWKNSFNPKDLTGWTLVTAGSGGTAQSGEQTSATIEDDPSTPYKGRYKHISHVKTGWKENPDVYSWSFATTYIDVNAGNWAWSPTRGSYWQPRGYVSQTVYVVPHSLGWCLAYMSSTEKTLPSAYGSSGPINQALFNALPNHSPDFSALNFIWELKDFRELAGYLASFGKRAKSVGLGKALNEFLDQSIDWLEPEFRKFAQMSSAARLNFLQRLRLRLGPKFCNVVDKIADGYLSWIFALKPFVCDSVAAAGLAKSASSKLDLWRKDEHRTRRSRGKATGSNTGGWVTKSYTFGYFRFRKVSTVTATVVTEIRTRPLRFPALDNFLSEYGFWLQPSTVWNAIPFSWMIDGFCNLGDIVSSMDTNMSMYQNARILGLSLKSSTSVEIEVKAGMNQSTWEPIGRVFSDSFVRDPSLTPWLRNPPQSPPDFAWKCPSAGQWLSDFTVAWKIFS